MYLHVSNMMQSCGLSEVQSATVSDVYLAARAIYEAYICASKRVK